MTEAKPAPDAYGIQLMLLGYIECIKDRGDYDRWHYIPEIEDAAEAMSRNIALIAVAHDLLTTLQVVEATLRCPSSPSRAATLRSAMETARSVIAKATGEQA
jgi:hypothetical protein